MLLKTFRKLSIFLLLMINNSRLSGQSLLADSAKKVNWLKENAITVASVDPGETNYADLRQLKAWIGDAQVVSIGEPAHQIGTVLLAKTRLIQFLHEEMGFGLVVLESDMYSVHKVWEHIKGDGNSFEHYKSNIFFASFDEYAPLYNYISSTARGSFPLELAGFDPQLVGTFASNFLLSDLQKYFSKLGYASPQLTDTSSFSKEINLLVGYNIDNAQSALKEISFLSRVLDSLAPQPLNKEGSFYKQLLRSIKKHAETVVLDKSRRLLSGDAYDCAASLHLSIRDQQMAENLLWYLKQDPGRKVIVVAHNTHLIKDYPGNRDKARWNDDPEAPGVSKAVCEENYMGYTLADSLRGKLFNIAFTVGEGKAGFEYQKDSSRNFTWTVEKSRKQNVLENYLDAAGMSNAIVNLKNPGKGGEWLQDYIRIRYYTGPGSLWQWSKAADAIFYVRKSTPLHE